MLTEIKMAIPPGSAIHKHNSSHLDSHGDAYQGRWYWRRSTDETQSSQIITLNLDMIDIHARPAHVRHR